MATTYTVNFGKTGSMVEVASGLSDTDWTVDTGALESSEEYSWRIDVVNEYGITYGDIWTFTAAGFLPPVTTGTPIQRLVAAAKDAIYYEDL